MPYPDIVYWMIILLHIMVRAILGLKYIYDVKWDLVSTEHVLPNLYKLAVSRANAKAW